MLLGFGAPARLRTVRWLGALPALAVWGFLAMSFNTADVSWGAAVAAAAIWAAASWLAWSLCALLGRGARRQFAPPGRTSRT
jgi:hypothetical protein